MSTEMHPLTAIKISVYDVKYDPEPRDFPMRMSMNNTVSLIKDLRKKFVSSGEYSMRVAINTAEILNNCSSCIQILYKRMGEKATPQMRKDFLQIMRVVLNELDNMIYDPLPNGKNKSNYLGPFTEWQAKKLELEDETLKLHLLEKRSAWHKAEKKKAKDAEKKLRSEIKQTKRQVRLAFEGALVRRTTRLWRRNIPKYRVTWRRHSLFLPKNVDPDLLEPQINKSSSQGDVLPEPSNTSIASQSPYIYVEQNDEEVQDLLDRMNKILVLPTSRRRPRGRIPATTGPQPSPKSSSVGDPIILVTYEEKQNMLVRINNALALFQSQTEEGQEEMPSSPGEVSPRCNLSTTTFIISTTSPEPSLKSSSSADEGVQNMLVQMIEAIAAPPILRNPESQDLTPSQESIPSQTPETETVEGQEEMQDLLDRIDKPSSQGEVSSRCKVTTTTTSPEPVPKLVTDEEMKDTFYRLHRDIAVSRGFLSRRSIDSTPITFPKYETEVKEQETSQDLLNQIVVIPSQSEVSSKHDSLTDLHRPASSTDPLTKFRETVSQNIPDSLGQTLPEKMANLLDWCEERTTKYDLPMYSFTQSWKSGRALIAIMHSYDENLIDPRYLTEESPRNTLTYGERVARSLGVLCPIEFAHECLQKYPDSINVMQFVMELRGRLEALF